MQIDFDKIMMSLAIEEARRALEYGDVPVGAVVTMGGEVVATAYNRREADNDPTAHAEIVAIRDACANPKTFSLAGCEIYASFEPCPTCLAAIYWARLDRIYYTATCQDATADCDG